MRAAVTSDLFAVREIHDEPRRVGEEREIERIYCGGDLVGYGPDPAAVLEAVERETRGGAIAVKGNHDAAITGPMAYLNDAAAAAIAWAMVNALEYYWFGHALLGASRWVQVALIVAGLAWLVISFTLLRRWALRHLQTIAVSADSAA